MKTSFFIFLSLLFFGCTNTKLATPQEENIQCQNAYAFISHPTITLEKNDLEIEEKNILQVLEDLMMDNCIVISNNPDSYEANLVVTSAFSSQNKEGIATKAQENTAKIKVSLSLKKDRMTRTFNSEHILTINGKKVLGIGQKAQITQEEKQKLLKSALKRVYKQAQNALR
ncbi:hypothetical protein [Helicobacter anatolicus]|uniref:hypothetical protein n=1 Tax=Helicobacter anatolicus TaxID=2905874 RepID=UPI001E43B5E8|nr:hypothetical protein [Helicobacter anatolicus]MCE3038685.1 hypothetical protein [Helicobacter anatolicus]